MKKILITVLMIGSGVSFAQTITPQVINSAGDHRQLGSSEVYISDNVGEPFTETIGPAGDVLITQGFLQPPVNDGVTIAFNAASCLTREDGLISISYSSLNPGHREQYIWSAGACPMNNCGNTVSNLKPGNYYVTIVSSYTTNSNVAKSDTIRRGPITIGGSLEPCRLKVYSGVTTNRDGKNDIWFIENISEFPKNRVTIYNRWGQQLFDANGYDNVTKYWPTEEMLNKLISSTYFYIIELGDGSKPIKGWVELIKNE
jgi:gliding motility-associated-like protein